jgi:hypothetical protein
MPVRQDRNASPKAILSADHGTSLSTDHDTNGLHRWHVASSCGLAGYCAGLQRLGRGLPCAATDIPHPVQHSSEATARGGGLAVSSLGGHRPPS